MIEIIEIARDNIDQNHKNKIYKEIQDHYIMKIDKIKDSKIVKGIKNRISNIKIKIIETHKITEINKINNEILDH